ncbi:MAG TPA: glycosyltransferase family 4 protein [Thermoplasmata archaeon]|nr:glycosyltransferase family 4 protein [Thermoplasmata archaeon]
MNILRIHSWDGATLGGVEIYLRRVSKSFADRGHSTVTAALVTDDLPPGFDSFRAYRVPRTPFGQAVIEVTERRRLRAWLEEVAAEAKPDVIHLHHFKTGFSVLGPWLARRPEPIVFTVHDTELVCPIATLTLPDGSECPGGVLPRCQFTGCEVGFGLPVNLAERYLFDRLLRDRIRPYLCVSHATRRVIERHGYRPTELLRPMIPVPAVPAPVASGPFTVGFLGRLDPQKGIDVLLRAFGAVRKEHPETQLRFGGTGPLPAPQGEGITADQWVTDVSSWLGGIHVLAVPSLGWENLGNSAIEALGHGVPVIVTDSGGLRETVGDFGTVVPRGDAGALAAAILRIRDQYGFARATAARGREWVREEFSPDHHIARLLEVYSKALRPGETL